MEFEDLRIRIEELFAWVPDWAISVVALTLAAGCALALHRTVVRLLRRLAGPRRIFLQSLISRSTAPARFALIIMALGAVLPALPLSRATAGMIGQGLAASFIVLVGWCAMTAIGLASDLYLRRYSDIENDLSARKHQTQIRILHRTSATLVVVATAAAALMTFPPVRQYGVSLIASAGAAGLILGLAARPVLANLIAGVQIAITQPIRLGDAVIVENEWGWIEEITSTYVVIKLWDWRRLVVPLSYFLEKPFQNWTRSSAELIGSVLLWVDYTVPVQRVRARLEEIAKASRLWDGKVVNLQVVDSSERAVQLRALVSARTAPQAWDLRCEVREALIAWLQKDYPDALPKLRNAMHGFLEERRAA